MKMFAAIGFVALLGVQSALAANIDMNGKYTGKDGAALTVERTTESGQYRITGKDSGDYFWEGAGYYSGNCKCIKSVFRYTSHKDKYGDNVGYHKFEIKDNGETLVKTGGGWEGINEFGTHVYTKNK